MAHGTIESNGITMWYDRIGREEDPIFLLVTGGHGQAIAWDLTFCEMLSERGFQVIRYDQRGTGYSNGSRDGTGYDAKDLADDAAGILDGLGIKEAHVAGVSAGGAIAQWIALRHPRKVLSLISLMSTSGDPRNDPLIKPMSEELKAFRSQPHPTTPEERIERMIMNFRDYLWGPRYMFSEEWVREYAKAMLSRGERAGDTPQVIEAVWSTLPIPAHEIVAPTLVIHGTEDPLLPYTAGLTTVRAVPGARLITVNGMGHDFISPRAFPMLIEAFVHHANTAPPMWVRDGLMEPPAE